MDSALRRKYIDFAMDLAPQNNLVAYRLFYQLHVKNRQAPKIDAMRIMAS